MMKNVFIIGSKGIPSNYGGFETFVEKLTEYNDPSKTDIKYHASCLSDNTSEFEHNNAHCFNVKVPNIGPAKAIYYDIAAFNYCLDYIRNENLEGSIIYVLACRIGPFFGHLVNKAKKLNVKVYVNPDGHEWKRAKWGYFTRKYWKLSEKLMVKHADLLICDSVNIEKYIQEDYKNYSPKTTYIAYGADVMSSTYTSDDEVVETWMTTKNVTANNYYLIVGRFVPENNYKAMIKEFMKSNTKRDLVIITNVEKNKFYDSLLNETKFDTDNRIKFVGTVYDQELLKYIRENAFAYLHGHEVGGTNPSLLEALASTKLNLLLDVGFNREVAKETALYWSKEEDSLKSLIESEFTIESIFITDLGQLSKENILNRFDWKYISNEYTDIFLVQS